MREQKPYNTLIIDDDKVAIEELKKGLAQHTSLIEIVGEAHTAETGKTAIFDMQPDLLFLDVELPDKKGVDLLNEIKSSVDWNMTVVFYSAHSKYILNAMRESAFDFLLKPFEQAELDGILQRFCDYRDTAVQPKSIDVAGNNLMQNNFIAATVTGFRIIRLDEIGYFTHHGLRKQWHAALVGGETCNLKRGTSAEDILGYSPLFIQISQSTIVNINYLAAINGKDCSLLPPFDKDDNLKISRNYLKKLQEKLNLI